jgi:uncharacterized protein YgbK (DUF1537 family)
MRYVLILGTLTLVVASGMAILSAGNAAGQQLNRFVPGPPGAVVVGQQVQATDEQSDELAQLNALDAKLGQEADSLAKQLAESTDGKRRDEIKAKLQETLVEQFDTQQKVRELEVSRIEAKVKKLRDVISKRNDARRTIIEKRLDQLVREADGLGWNSPTTGSPGYGAVYAPQTSSYYAPSSGIKPVPGNPVPARR